MKCKSFLSIASWIIIMTCLVSCSKYEYYNIHVLNPAEIKLGPNIQKIYILCDFCNFKDMDKNPNTSEKSDNVSTLNFLYSLKENLERSPIFDSTQITLIPLDSLLLELQDLKNRISSNNLIISLDTLNLQNVTIIPSENNHEEVSILDLDITFVPDIFAIVSRIKCRVYDTRRFVNIDSFSRKDTLFFPNKFFSEEAQEIIIPPLEDRIWDASIKGANKYANHLAPFWSIENRTLFLGGNRAFRNATHYIMENKIDTAFQIFNHLLKTKKMQKSYKSKVLHNYAVLLEMADNYEAAIAAEEQSNSLKKNEYFSGYLDILRHRKVNKIALDWQLEH